jgi:dihydrofolate reductase
MSRLKFSIAMSLDGFVAGPDQSEENPLGERGEELHEWALRLDVWREAHGRDGGEESPSSAVMRNWVDSIGATIMGRNMFGPIRGEWSEPQWDGWWGEDPPFHHPVFVLTHHPREPLTLQGGTTFTFVTDGIESALDQARAAAGDKDVHVSGGAATAQQYLKAGLIDELQLNVAPIMLGSGDRLFENVGDLRLECIDAVNAVNVTHLTYRVIR